jgi:hypothetical protein
MARALRAAALSAILLLLCASAVAAAPAKADEKKEKAAAAAEEAAAAAAAAADPEVLSREAQAIAAKGARMMAAGHAGHTAGEALAAEQGREAAAAKRARGPLAPGGTRSAGAAYARSGAAEAAALACAAEWHECGAERERGDLLTVSCELGDESAYCFEGYLSEALTAAPDGEEGEELAIFRCRRGPDLNEASSACAAPSSSWTRSSTGGVGAGGLGSAAAFTATSSGDPQAALEAYQKIAAQAAQLREGILGAARLGGLAASPEALFGAGSAELGTLLDEDAAMAFGMA